MTSGQIDFHAFTGVVIAEFPSLKEDLESDAGLPYLQMSGLHRFTEQAMNKEDWQTVRRCLALLERFLKFGDSDLQNAVYVSFLEHIDTSGKHWPTLKSLMPPIVLNAHANTQAYWAEHNRAKSPSKAKNSNRQK